MKRRWQIGLRLPMLAVCLVSPLWVSCGPAARLPVTSLEEVRKTIRNSPRPGILWIGNSYSFGAPAEFQSLARRQGRRIECRQITHSGWTLSRHASNPETILAIRSRRWDVVILQEQSRRPSVLWRLYLQSLPAATSLAEEVRRAGALPVLYQTWGYRTGDPSRWHDSFLKMNQRLRQGYRMISSSIGAPVVAVGDDWEHVLETSCAPDLFRPDGAHPSQDGVRLIAKSFEISLLSK